MTICTWCDEPILPGDWPADVPAVQEGAAIVTQMHPECAIRSVIGSVGHLRGTCSCAGGTEDDPPGMTKREAAAAAAALYHLEPWRAAAMRRWQELVWT